LEISGIPVWIWGSFLGFVLVVLALDLGVFHRAAHVVRMKEALVWSAVWMGLAMAFAAIIFTQWHNIRPESAYSNTDAGFAFVAGYLVEWALSVDNLFVFLLVFAYFHVPPQYQHRVLFWGIVGALIFRMIFIALGAVVLERFHWSMILFGVFLVFTGIKMIRSHGTKIDPTRNPVIKLFRKLVRTTPDYHGQKFLVRIAGQLWVTPLLVTLIVVEFTDIVFAIDSVPAIFAITREPFIVFTSNVFAILGLRSLFFALAGLMQMFRYLHYGLAAILMFVGGKMLYGYLEKDVFPQWPSFPVWLSLVTILATLAVAVLVSLLRPPRRAPIEALKSSAESSPGGSH
jgi:tellurite resistance protein TerC